MTNTSDVDESTKQQPTPLDTPTGTDQSKQASSEPKQEEVNQGSNKKHPNGKWDFSNYLLIITIIGVLAGSAYYFDWIKLPTFGQKIAVVDTSLLVMAVSSEVNQDFKNGKITLEQSQSIISNYINEMYQEVEDYAASGYTIIPSQNVMFYSDKHDITEDIANKIGVSYENGLNAMKELKMSSTSGNAFQQSSNTIQNQQLNGNTNQQEGVNFEDYTQSDLSISKDGNTSDLELFDGQN
jgi:hypothetical protein